MSTAPTQQTPDTPTPETVEERFRRLEKIWESATWFSSSSTQIRSHSAFREIINLGEADGLPPVDWAAIVEKLEAGSPPAPDGHEAGRS